MTGPNITILMAVYNGAPFLRDAIDSIFAQTYPHFELLVVNDGSSDSTADVLQSYSDPRLIVITNERNLGLVASLNKGLDLARGELVSRMDADDLCLPERLEKQFLFLKGNPRVGLCGTWFRTFGAKRPTIVHPPQHSDDIAARLFYESPIGHPTVMFRRGLFAQQGLSYKNDLPYVEDYELWTRAAEVTELANIPEVLLEYRYHEAQVSSQKQVMQRQNVDKIRLRQLNKIYPQASEVECTTHLSILANESSGERQLEPSEVEAWLLKLIALNESRASRFPIEAFRRALALVWWRYCAARYSAPGILRAFYKSELTRVLPMRNKIGLLALRTKANLSQS